MEFKSHFYWVSVGALLGFALLYTLGFILALTFRRRKCSSVKIIKYEHLLSFSHFCPLRMISRLSAVGKSRAIISRDKLSEINGDNDVHNADTTYPESAKEAKNKGQIITLCNL